MKPLIRMKPRIKISKDFNLNLQPRILLCIRVPEFNHSGWGTVSLSYYLCLPRPWHSISDPGIQKMLLNYLINWSPFSDIRKQSSCPGKCSSVTRGQKGKRYIIEASGYCRTTTKVLVPTLVWALPVTNHAPWASVPLSIKRRDLSWCASWPAQLGDNWPLLLWSRTHVFAFPKSAWKIFLLSFWWG